MADTPTRSSAALATRARIAEVGLDLFMTKGYAATTIDQIADAAGVGRRTVFRHFATKESILFDHLVVRREEIIQRLGERPGSEQPLASLHAVLRELAAEGYDRRLLAQIRSVVATEPGLVSDAPAGGTGEFARRVVATLEAREGDQFSSLEINALTLMAINWFLTAAHIYLTEGRSSLLTCFDEVVSTCVQASASSLG